MATLTHLQRSARGWLAFSAILLAGITGITAQPTEGLLVHWNMDETTGLALSDSSGNARTGDLVNFLGDDTQWVEGKTGGALEFHGTDYVALAGLPETMSTTWAAWVKLPVSPNNGAVVSSTFPGATAGHSLGFGSGADAMKPRVVWNHNVGNTIILSPTPVQLNEWNHVAVAYDAATSSLKLYLNGELQAQNSAPSASTAFSTINLGRREASANTHLTAVIDDVVIYNRALSLEEIQGLAGRIVSGPPVITRGPEARTVFEASRVEWSVEAQGLEPFSYQWKKNGNDILGATESTFVIEEATEGDEGTYTVVVSNSVDDTVSEGALLTVNPIDLSIGLQAHWRFDESTGLTAEDSTANNNDGALFNFAGDDTQWVQGYEGGAIEFNGANNVQVPDSPSIGSSLVNGFTISSWIRSNVDLPATGGNRAPRLLEKGNSYFFLMNPGTGGMNLLVKRNTANVTANLMDPIQAGRWYHLAGTFDGNVIRVYLDGEFKGETVVGGPIDDPALPLFIGSDDATGFFNGAMDELQIWNRPLNAQELLNVMGRDLPEPPSFRIQPEPVTRYAGATARFRVEARGQEPFSYQWFKGTEEIRNAVGPELILENVQPGDSGEYSVRVTNALGSETSDAGLLTVTPVENLASGLAAHWKFDETGGLVAADSSEANLDATLLNFGDETTHWVEGQVGGAIALDGVLNEALVPDSGGFEADGESTFAFWINPTTYGTEQNAGNFTFREGRILRKPQHIDLFVVDNPGGVRRTIILNGVSAPQGSLLLNEWQHFAAVLRNGMMQFYKNGFPIGEPKPGTLGAPGDLNISIGNFDDSGGVTPRYFSGSIDELAIWNRPLSEAEILEVAGRDFAGEPVIAQQPQSATRLEGNNATFTVHATGKRPVSYKWFHDGVEIAGATGNMLTLIDLELSDAGDYTVEVTNSEGSVTSTVAELVVESLDHITSGLIAYWNFDETSGTKLMDQSGKGNDGDLQNFEAAAGTSGAVGGALNFDGLDDFIVVPHDGSLDVTDQVTISAWINPRSHGTATTGNLGRIVRKSVNYDLTLTTAGAGTLLFYGINKNAYYAPNAAVTLNGWQHVAIVVNDGLIQYYKDGVALGAPIPGDVGETNLDPLIIGNFQGDLAINRLFDGVMDELGIWSRALTPGDIAGIYENGLLGKPLTATFEPLAIETLSMGEDLELTFYSPYSNRPYAVQTKADLADDWAEQADVDFAPGANDRVTASFATPSGPVGYYRIVALPAAPVYSEDFENSAAGWTHGSSNGTDNWELGTPTQGPMAAHSGANVYATGLGSNYPGFADSYLRSPVIDLREVTRGTLRFWEWRNTDPDPTFHGTIINVLDADSGAVLEELGRGSGPTGGWVQRTIKLGSNSLAKRIQLQFQLYADGTNLQEGWFIDDITITPE